ncbi:hypothetical protein V6N12_074821 [Hibiscus sabdariffa]|uniref:Uncharacterized protein n=1 Tax=Hibiscus sabdariffa TaxID=183260 RepID=A0ABR2D2J0_9ROSI
MDSSNGLKGSLSETRLHWHQKAIFSVIESGGLDWTSPKVSDVVPYKHG